MNNKNIGVNAIKPIDIFPWNENFNTGLADIDTQHRKLTQLINLLASHVAFGSDLPQLNVIFDELADYTVYHFKTEEDIWHQYMPDDAASTMHHTVHLGFIQTVTRLKNSLVTKSPDEIVEDTLSYLARWLASHMLENDRQMAFVVKAIESGLSLEAAKQQAADKVRGTAHELVEIILTTYAILSNNTLNLMMEINKLRVAEGTIREQNEFLNAIIDNGPECVKVIGKNGCLIKMNRAGLNLLEVDCTEEVNQIGLIEFVVPEHRDAFIRLNEKVFNGHPGKLEFLVRGKLGSLRWLETHATPMKNAAGEVTSLLGITRDITVAKESQHQLEYLAQYDALTELPNRVLLADRLQQAMSQCRRRKISLVVAYLDLDGFKVVNDKYGHDIGDELLIAVAKNMKLVLREGDTLARVGGDEFVAVLVDLEQSQDCEPVLDRLLAAASKNVTVESLELQVSASIGVTFYPQDEGAAEQLVRHADQAMYEAKLAGKNRYLMFDFAKDAAVQTQRESLTRIRLALNQQEFVLHYQPKVNIKTGEVIGVEALIRWQHPERGLLPPATFLPIIEDHSIAVELGNWVISTALMQMHGWMEAGISMPVSVNVSGRQLQQSDFAKQLANHLAAYPDIPPQWLELEILETSVLVDLARTSEIMNACRELGVTFALDDFGTGYSSLAYLKHLPAALIKIDQTFVRDMLTDANDLAIVQGVIGLAQAFHRAVIAEGVETDAHAKLLLSMGCELAQGYGIARPMPASELPRWVDSWAVTWCANVNFHGEFI